MTVDIVGEDAVTQAIIKRLLSDFRPDISIGKIMPVRGGQIKTLAPNFNRLETPVILLTDLDNEECPPSLIRSWLNNVAVSETMLFRVACDEAENWLMADREGFAKWLSVDSKLIPQPTPASRRSPQLEIRFRIKPSLFLMLNLAATSGNKQLKEQLMPRNGASKGPNYNTAIVPFINTFWNIQNAANNSHSLHKTITRIQNFNP